MNDNEGFFAGLLVVGLTVAAYWLFRRSPPQAPPRPVSPVPFDGPGLSPRAPGNAVPPGVGLLDVGCLTYAAVKTGGAAAPLCSLAVPAVRGIVSETDKALSRVGQTIDKKLPKPLAITTKIATAPIWAPTKAIKKLGKVFGL